MRKLIAVLAVALGVGAVSTGVAFADTSCEAGDDQLAQVCAGDVVVTDLVDLSDVLDLD